MVGGFETDCNTVAETLPTLQVAHGGFVLTRFHAGSIERIPTSQLILAVLADAPSDHVTLAWLFGNLRRRSFGMVTLLLGLIAMIPGVCIAAGFVLAALGCQMMMAHDVPILPPIIARHPISTRQITRLLFRTVPIIVILERFIKPRWQTPFLATKRFVGLAVLLLAVTVFLPIPLSNVLPGALIMLIAFSYLEEDGILLSIALTASIVSLILTLAEAWALIRGVGHLLRM